MKNLWLQIALLLLLFASNTFANPSQDEMRISLQPGQNKDIKITEPHCLEFTSDYRTRLYLIGQSYNWVLPKGTKYVVEAGDYHIENPGPAILDFALLPAAMCGN